MSESKHTPREWLIRKGGYFYRRDCQGYTTNKFEAGRYTKDEADAEAAVEPWHMKAVHQDDWPDDAPSVSIRELVDTLRWVRANYAGAPTKEVNERLDAAIARAEGRAEAPKSPLSMETAVALLGYPRASQ